VQSSDPTTTSASSYPSNCGSSVDINPNPSFPMAINSTSSNPRQPYWLGEMDDDDGREIEVAEDDWKFEGLWNFRDVGQNYNQDLASFPGGESLRRIKEGMFFRSGKLDDATPRDLDRLMIDFSIKSVIDLRGEFEQKCGSNLVSAFPGDVINPGMARQAIDALEEQAGGKRRIRTRRRVRELEAEVGRAHPPHATYYINFTGNRYRHRNVWKPLPMRSKFEVISLCVQGKKPEAVKLIGETFMEPKGMLQLYEGFVNYCGAEIVAALKIIASSDSYPLLVHCSQGKDRTGLVCAMTLSLLGAPDELIIKDYLRTNQGLEPIRQQCIDEMARDGLSPDFTYAPPEVIEHALQYIKRVYDGVQSYLLQNGLTLSDIQCIRENLLEPSSSAVASVL